MPSEAISERYAPFRWRTAFRSQTRSARLLAPIPTILCSTFASMTTVGQLERPFADTIPLTDQYGAVFERLETRLIPAIDGNDPAAIVWLAHTPYAGSIPRRLGVRGLRARMGNIQIGSDRIFEHLFLEARFNGWCVGEIHILDKRLLPNSRRDYFEPSPHLRNIENHIGAIAHEISSRCRQASSQRNKLRNIGAAINRLRRARDLAVSGYLCSEDATALVERERKRIPEIKQTLAQLELPPRTPIRRILPISRIN